jgi:hypothetical protein
MDRFAVGTPGLGVRQPEGSIQRNILWNEKPKLNKKPKKNGRKYETK